MNIIFFFLNRCFIYVEKKVFNYILLKFDKIGWELELVFYEFYVLYFLLVLLVMKNDFVMYLKWDLFIWFFC